MAGVGGLWRGLTRPADLVHECGRPSVVTVMLGGCQRGRAMRTLASCWRSWPEPARQSWSTAGDRGATRRAASRGDPVQPAAQAHQRPGGPEDVVDPVQQAPPATQRPGACQMGDRLLHQRAQPRLEAVERPLPVGEPVFVAAVPDRRVPVLACLGLGTRGPAGRRPRPGPAPGPAPRGCRRRRPQRTAGCRPRWPAVMTINSGRWPCSQARCSLVVSPPRDRPSPWWAGSRSIPPGGSTWRSPFCAPRPRAGGPTRWWCPR
jgi:hypothetical protein